MREGAKRRLAGAVVIVALAVIFVPMLFEDESLAPPLVSGSLPDEPAFEGSLGVDAPLPLADEPAGMGDAGLAEESDRLEAPAVSADAYEEPDFEALGTPGQLGLSVVADGPPPLASEPVLERVEPAPAATRSTPAPKPAPTPKPAQPPKPETASAPSEPPRPRADGMPSWVVQVSSLGSSEAAEKLAGKLKQSGFSAFVQKAEVGGKTYYRVRVGPDIDRANAERTAAMLRQQQKLDTLIQRYP